MRWNKSQDLNDWVEMLDYIYGQTQNYSKSSFEVYSHLAEVCGAFGKFAFKRRDLEKAKEFLPKIFVWAATLFKKVKGKESNLEENILTKYPTVCPYCYTYPCNNCWQKPIDKSKVDNQRIQELYYKNAEKQKRSLNDFQLMFARIYKNSWGFTEEIKGTSDAFEKMSKIHIHLIEELSELAEAMRFQHLHPSNFDNEIADFIAWWFALVTNFHFLSKNEIKQILVSDLVWAAYPGYCLICGLEACDCRPGPVRELLSRPALKDLSSIDGLTQTYNQINFHQTLEDISNQIYPVVSPISCVRIDIDKFKSINDNFSHQIGDDILKHVVNILRQKVRQRDKIFRVGGDEFAIICFDLNHLEAQGMMMRVQCALKEKPISAININGQDEKIRVTLSIGITECSDFQYIKIKFDKADKLAMQSKESGRDKITIEG